MPASRTPEGLIRPEIRALSAYHVAPAKGLIKLDAMENPYSWPEPVVAQWLQRLERVALNRYPDPAAEPLKRSLRAAFQIPDSMEVLLGNGSDELIQMLAMAVAGPDRVVLAPQPSFVMYEMIAAFAGLRFAGVPLRKTDFGLDMPAMRAAITDLEPALIFLAYPNNPTGNLFERRDVEQIIESAPGLVVLDEAYAAFCDASFMGELDRYPNLLVMRTVSKMGLAGLRLGLLVGAPEWLGELEKLRLPYNINVLTQVSAEFALEHKSVFDQQTEAIRQDRERLLEALRELEGIEPYPSQANFILFRIAPERTDRVFDALREAGVLVKNLGPAGGLLSGCLRVTVGRPEENRRFLEALREALATN